MTSIQIDKGVAVPKSRKTGRPGFIRSALAKMEVGDSFFLSAEMYKSREACSGSVRAVTSKFSKATGRKFVTRNVVEDGVDGIRCWRAS